MFPQFICIGAQKSGTTWLYKNLKDHPQIWLPPFKEIKYFNKEDRRAWLITLLSNQRGRIILRRKVKRAFDDVKKGQHIRWYLRYFFLPRNDGWYASLFSPREGQIAGDISPGYDMVNQNMVSHIYSLMPDLKIIYLLRNPIDRMWSHAAMDLRKWDNKLLHTCDEETIKGFLDRETVIRRTDYLKTLQAWEQVYPKEQIFVAFFEQLKQNPRQLLMDIHHFLEVEASYIPDSVEQKVYAGQYSQIPAHWARYLAQRHHEQLKALHQRFDNSSTASWLELAENIRSTPPTE